MQWADELLLEAVCGICHATAIPHSSSFTPGRSEYGSPGLANQTPPCGRDDLAVTMQGPKCPACWWPSAPAAAHTPPTGHAGERSLLRAWDMRDVHSTAAMQMPAQHLLLSAQVLLPLLHNLLCFTAAEPAPSATTLTMLLQAGISYAQCALRTHLDIAACVKAVKLVDNLKHSALHLVVTTSTVVKACTTCRQQCTQAGRHMASRHEVSACIRKSKT